MGFKLSKVSVKSSVREPLRTSLSNDPSPAPLAVTLRTSTAALAVEMEPAKAEAVIANLDKLFIFSPTKHMADPRTIARGVGLLLAAKPDQAFDLFLRFTIEP